MPTARPRLRLHRSLASAAMALAMLAALPSTALPVAADTNPVVTENAQPGSGGWGLSKLADDVNGQIKGYGSASSVTQGGSISLYVSVNPAQTYTIDVFRMGWYAGSGARKRLHAGPINGTTQAACAPDATTGMIACGWAAGYAGTVTFSTSDLVAMQLGKMPTDYTFTGQDAGTRTFSGTLMTPPSQTITVTDTVDGSLSATSPPIAVGPM